MGLTPRNSAQYEFNPDLARQLLDEADYNPDNEIIINVFAGRFFRNVEVAEAQAQMWREVGVNAKIQVLETANWLERARTGCGRATQFYFVDEGLEIPDTFCVETDPGPPLFGFPHSFQLNPSLEALDLGRYVGSRMDCRGSGSKFCDPVNVQPLIDPCLAAGGNDRKVCMTELADIAYDQVLMYTYFNAEVLYGVSEDLTWTPRFDRRARVNQWDLR